MAGVGCGEAGCGGADAPSPSGRGVCLKQLGVALIKENLLFFSEVPDKGAYFA